MYNRKKTIKQYVDTLISQLIDFELIQCDNDFLVALLYLNERVSEELSQFDNAFKEETEEFISETEERYLRRKLGEHFFDEIKE